MPTYYKRDATGTTNWNVATSWSTVSSTSAVNAGTFPSSATLDPVIFDVNSASATVNVNSVCTTLNTTGFLGTITLTGTLTANGNVTLGSQVGHIAGAANLIMNANGTLDVQTGVTIPNLQLGNSAGSTITLSRSTSVTNLSKGGSFGNTTVTAGTIGTLLNVTGGSIQSSGAALVMAANVTLTINGSCTVAVGGISYAGNIVLASGSTLTTNGTITVNNVTAGFNTSAGTFVPGTQSFTMQNVSANVTFNMGATNSFWNLTVIGTVILASDLRITNNLSAAVTGISGAFDIIVDGNITGGTITNSTTGRKITVTGLTTNTCTITTLSLAATGSNTYKLEIACGSRAFVMTGLSTFAGGLVTIDYLTSNSGSFTATGSTLSYTGGTLIINMTARLSTYVWGTLQNTGGVGRSVTLLSDVYFNTIGTTSSTDSLNGPWTLHVFGNVGTMSNISGTATLKFIGSSNATWTVTAGVTVSIAAIVFARTGGTLSIPNSFIYTGSTGITWQVGTISHTATLTLGTTTLATSSAGMSWNNLTINSGATITINQPLSVTGILSLTGGATFTGTDGWTCTSLVSSAAGPITISLKELVSYRTISAVSITGGTAAVGNRVTMTSSGAATRAIWTLDPGATQTLIYVNGTRIDSSQNNGQTIWTFGGTISTTPPGAETLNWNIGTRPGTSSYVFVN
jgi:hypothetical protein